MVSTQEGLSNCIELKLWCYICRTSLESPSKSLVESILQQRIVPKTAAMQWGIDMESVAKQAYVKSIKDKHELFEIDDAGLYINLIKFLIWVPLLMASYPAAVVAWGS